MWLGDATAPAPAPGGVAEAPAIEAAAAPAAPGVIQNSLTNVLSSLLVGRKLSEAAAAPEAVAASPSEAATPGAAAMAPMAVRAIIRISTCVTALHACRTVLRCCVGLWHAVTYACMQGSLPCGLYPASEPMTLAGACLQAPEPRGLPALQAIPDLGLPAMPEIVLPADPDALLAPIPPRPSLRRRPLLPPSRRGPIVFNGHARTGKRAWLSGVPPYICRCSTCLLG